MEINPQFPCIHPAEGQRNTGVDLVELPKNGVYGGVIFAVAQEEFVVSAIATLKKFGRYKRVFFDMKSLFPQDESDRGL